MNCPKCGAHISPFDLKPNCKNCGVNILLYSQEYLLERDAKRTELEFACGRIILAKFKANFIGGALPIIRVITTLLCVASLLIPFSELNISMPVMDEKISLGGIGIYNIFSSGLFSALFGFSESVLFGASVKSMLVQFALYFAVALCDVFLVVVGILSFLSIKKSAKAMSIASAIGFCFSVAAFITALLANGASTAAYVDFKIGFGSSVAALMLCVNAFLNYKVYKNDLPLKVHENDYKRKELLKRIKKGELDFDNLPLPVYETEEEKEQRLKELEKALDAEEDGN